MSINDLKNIIKNKRDEAEAENSFNPQEQINEYIILTNNLYKAIRESIKELVDDDLVSLRMEKISIYEEGLGDYNIESLYISFANEKVQLKPVGTMLIGSKGRVDMIGPKGIERFTLIRKGIKSPSQLIKVTVSVVGGGNLSTSPEKKLTPKSTIDDWEWKILPNEINWSKFEEVTNESIIQALMRVING
ncbi:TPA: hypothetical protein ACVEY8_004042 [Yersinia enterocolitica]|uniref:hypothetical protein n=1 Tax=Yersinia enterocolitica TaxID=630 RepID=UPI001C8D2D36|nr:hypothetical protein [Yersinia enterocolitica]ELI8161202.1 hypothetical protein [Yersinia enterocolitica]MBX9496762.1 hypothetical protein [Yersinia enterocolitica]HEB2009408.1 hypothetical protein [Yersinia enterocolitica]HEG1706407.1 hypothetical protein [Yersinia enterocolitica]